MTALLAAAATWVGCVDDRPGGARSSVRDTASNAEPGNFWSRPFYLGGIQVHEADHGEWFDQLLAQGMNTVELTEYAKQGDWDTDHMWWDEDAPWVLQEMRGAEARGLSTIFICRVALDHAFDRNTFLWHGMIQPKTDELIASWFEQYGRFVVERATIAEREGVDLFVVGSEMNALATTLPAIEPPPLEDYYLDEEKQADRRVQILAQQTEIGAEHLSLPERHGYPSVEEYIDARIAIEQAWARSVTGSRGAESLGEINARRALLDRHWRALIAKVREVYSGPVGYAANFDQYHLVGFWDALDFMGINAYFELRHELVTGADPDDPSSLEDPEHLYPLLVAGWSDVLGKIDTFRAEQGLGEQPVVFTELGYTYRAKSTIRPWAHDGFTLVYQPTTEDDGTPGETREYVVVWRDQPVSYGERALALRALHEAHSDLASPFLRGLLYWKLSSHDYHLDDESFMIHVGPDSEDPALAELRRFVEPETEAGPR